MCNVLMRLSRFVASAKLLIKHLIYYLSDMNYLFDQITYVQAGVALSIDVAFPRAAVVVGYSERGGVGQVAGVYCMVWLGRATHGSAAAMGY